jgi:hypothetical protein
LSSSFISFAKQWPCLMSCSVGLLAPKILMQFECDFGFSAIHALFLRHY